MIYNFASCQVGLTMLCKINMDNQDRVNLDSLLPKCYGNFLSTKFENCTQ